MDIEAFWKLIDKTRKACGGDISKQADLLIEALIQLSGDEILAFDTILQDMLDEAYDAALWDAADVIGCGCGDDGFYEFRGWLIAQGRDVYENALADPESLIDLIGVEDNAQDGTIIYVATPTYERKTGQELPWGYRRNRKPTLLKGEHWAEEDRKKRFPKLAAKFGNCEQRWAMWLGS